MSPWSSLTQDPAWDAVCSSTIKVTGWGWGVDLLHSLQSLSEETGTASGVCVFFLRAGKGLICLLMLQDCVV